MLDYIIFGECYDFEENSKIGDTPDEIISTITHAAKHMNELFTENKDN